MAPDLLRCAPLLVLLILAASQDVRDRRIPNWLTLLLILGGVAQSFFPSRMASPAASLLGVLVGAAVPFALFAIGALGAGDVKLMAGVGAWVGPLPVLAVFAIAGVVGMVIVLVQAITQGRVRTLFRNSVVIALNLLYVKEVGVEHASHTGRSSRSVDRPLPYAVPVLAAVLVVAAKTRKWG